MLVTFNWLLRVFILTFIKLFVLSLYVLVTICCIVFFTNIAAQPPFFVGLHAKLPVYPSMCMYASSPCRTHVSVIAMTCIVSLIVFNMYVSSSSLFLIPLAFKYSILNELSKLKLIVDISV